MSYNIALYGSHNATVAIEKNQEIVLVLELERLVNVKNQGFAQYKTFKTDDLIYYADYLNDFLLKELNIDEFETCYYMNSDVNIDEVNYKLHESIKAKRYVECKHHASHAAGSFYQSPYKHAIIFSFDGGGNDGFFNIYKAERGKPVELIETVLHPAMDSPHEFLDLGFPYMCFGDFLEDIRQEIDLGAGNLVYPGKIMGLCSYGQVREEWLSDFKDFYTENRFNGPNVYPIAKLLGSKIGVDFDRRNRITGSTAYDVAATSQRAFEEVFLSIARPIMEQYKGWPICMAGGCGLNIILNSRLRDIYGDVFVGPGPNDCGLAPGMLLQYHFHPMRPVDITYSGMELLDLKCLSEYMNGGSHFISKGVDVPSLAEDLYRGKIVGVARGRAEHGPRALGNRSILCNPAFPDMKDILNKKVKHREWYRPFAPVVRRQDVSKFFHFTGESRWMSFCPKVRDEYRDKIPSVVHTDGTARVQTVTRSQNRFLYDLLTEMDKHSGIGILLNTSFNVNGKPILNTIKDAFHLFHNSEMDGLVIEDSYFTKR